MDVKATATKPTIGIRTYAGPNVFVPFAAVAAEFAIPATIPAPQNAVLPEVIYGALPADVIARIRALEWRAPFEILVAGVAQALQDWLGPNDLPCQTGRTPSGRGRVYLGYHDDQATASALQLGYELALLAIAQGQEAIDASGISARVAQLGKFMQIRLPGELERAMIRGARAREIPFYRVMSGQRMLQYGQGKYGRHFILTGSECDSHTGSMLQFNKVISNLLVTRLGLPGVEHGVAQTATEATCLSNQLGYPVVIKPVDGRQGQGVSVGVASEEEVVVAFQQASAISHGHAIVERLVHGEDVRLYAFAGQFSYAVLRSPAQVMGDGMHTIVELIELENHSRPTEGYPKQLKIDQNMIAVLQKQKLQLNDYVPAGQIVTLRSVANADAGGTLTVITDRVHGDNRRMAEAIARCFRLHNVGIDFVTPDISKSWRDVPCAVIEVNAVPTILSTEPIRLLFERTFPGHSAGRIPSVVMVSTEPARGKGMVQFLRRKGLTTGFVDPASICLNDELRVIKDSRLAEKVHALLLDPACEALVVACRPEQIIEQGFPLDRCTICVLEPEVRATEPLRRLLKQCSEQMIEQIPSEGVLIQWLSEKHELQK